MKYICSCCGEEKEDWSAIAYDSPSLYMDLSDEEKKVLNYHLIFASSDAIVKPFILLEQFSYRT